jgi:hypothetical protein
MVTLKLEPYDALNLLCFLREFKYEHPQTKALGDSVDAFEKELAKKLTDAQLDEAYAQRAVNVLLKREPEMP